MIPPTAHAQPTIRRTYNYRLYPTRVQAAALDAQLAFNCDLYNSALEQRRDAWKRGKRVSLYDQQWDLTDLRASGDYPDRMACHVQRDPLKRLDRAFQAFFRRCKAGETPGYPRWRSKARYDSLTWPYGNGVGLRDGRLRLAGVGSVRVRWHREIPEGAEIRTITVRRQGRQWFACLSCLIPATDAVHRGGAVGLDLGVTNHVALSTGELLPGLRIERDQSKRVRKAARKVTRRKRGSKRRRKAVALLVRHRQREANRRRDHAHKLSRRLVTAYGLIAVEDLAITNMVRSAKGTVENLGRNVRQKAGLNRAIADQSWAQLIEFLTYKAEEAGGSVVKVGAAFTSQTCSDCGYVDAASRKGESFVCTACSLADHADVNAARNILNKALGRSAQARTRSEEACVV